MPFLRQQKSGHLQISSNKLSFLARRYASVRQGILATVRKHRCESGINKQMFYFLEKFEDRLTKRLTLLER